MPLRSLLKICTTVTLLFGTSLVASVPALAGTINITYVLTGVGTVTGMTSISLDRNGAFTGSVDQANTAENAVWNPVTYNDVSRANLSTALLNGNFSITFANGEMLSGMVGENVSPIINSPIGTGPFTQTLTFTAGTGEFAGVSGYASGTGFEGEVTGTVSGSGTLTAPGLITPERGSIAFLPKKTKRVAASLFEDVLAIETVKSGTSTGDIHDAEFILIGGAFDS